MKKWEKPRFVEVQISETGAGGSRVDWDGSLMEVS
mgnify:FL=1|jgi:hypothetical protein